jgi:Glycosyl transferase family 11
VSVIVTRLTGGLGNQMFQFAAGYALSLRRGVPLELDISSYERDELRIYELVSYELPAKLAAPATLQRIPRKARGLEKLVQHFGSRAIDTIPLYREPHFEFDPKVLDLPAPHALQGYWQSERYFADVSGKVRLAFTPTLPLEPENASVMEAIRQAAMPVSLHVRRGDYVSDASASAIHGTCSLDYYRTAIASILDQTPNAHFFAFSDDEAWTRQNLTSHAPITYVAANPPSRGYRDMQLMSACQHHIIANSSFSWWGAWLNNQSGKRVIAPARWFSQSAKNPKDLVPVSWERI